MDLAPSAPEGLRLRRQRHRRPSAGHPLHGGLVNTYDYLGGEVHRLLHAAQSSRVDLLRMAPQGRSLMKTVKPLPRLLQIRART